MSTADTTMETMSELLKALEHHVSVLEHPDLVLDRQPHEDVKQPTSQDRWVFILIAPRNLHKATDNIFESYRAAVIAAYLVGVEVSAWMQLDVDTWGAFAPEATFDRWIILRRPVKKQGDHFEI